jgi:hypothetical protein
MMDLGISGWDRKFGSSHFATRSEINKDHVGYQDTSKILLFLDETPYY